MNRFFALLATLLRRPAGPAPVQPTIRAPAARVAAGASVMVAGTALAWLVVATPFVAQFEGYSGKPYYDSVHVRTICYGATAADHVDFSKIYSKAACLQMLGKDLQKYDAEIRPCIPKIDTFPPHRHAALVSFAYNLGPHALCGPVGRYLNNGNIAAGCRSILAYDHAGGRILAGLTTRRRAEYAYCLRND